MKKVRLGINGFGRIGRLVLRIAQSRDDVEVVAINDPFLDPAYAVYLLKYDSVHGRYDVNAKEKDGQVVVGRNKIAFYQEMDPKNIPWGKHDVDVVVECTGKFTSYETAQVHLEAGAKKVVISAPGKNTSSPPSSFARKPYPFSALNHFTLPVILVLPNFGSSCHLFF